MAKLDLITSSTRPASPAAGKAYFETDTNKVIIWDGTAWTELVSDTAPAFSNAYSVDLDGTNDYVNVVASTDFAFGTSNFSFSVWFNPDVISGYRSVVDFRPSNGDLLPALFNSPTGGFKLYVWAGASKILNYDTALTPGQWYHAVYTRSGAVSYTHLTLPTTPYV